MRFTLVFFMVFTVSFSTQAQEVNAQQIIDNAIDKIGGAIYTRSTIKFTFRKKRFEVWRKGGEYKYTRSFKEGDNQIEDVLSNKGFIRRVNDEVMTLGQRKADALSSSVNSVIYFAFLPYRLNDNAVIKKYLGEVEIKGKLYYKVQINFKQEGGGEDYTDTFIYWISKEDYFLDYLAYTYQVDGGGIRFREATNARNIGEIRVVDYVNYKSTFYDIPLRDHDKLFEQGKLSKLSDIKLEEISVIPVN